MKHREHPESGKEKLRARKRPAHRANIIKRITQGVAFSLGLGLAGPVMDIGAMLQHRTPTKPLKISAEPHENPLDVHENPLARELPDVTLQAIEAEYKRWLVDFEQVPEVGRDARADYKLRVQSFLSFIDRCADMVVQTAPAFAMPPPQDPDPHTGDELDRLHVRTTGEKILKAIDDVKRTGTDSPTSRSIPPSRPDEPSGSSILIPLILLGLWIRSKKGTSNRTGFLLRWGSLLPLAFSDHQEWWLAEFLWLLFPADLLLRLAQREGRGEAISKIAGYAALTAGWGALITTWYFK